MTSAAKYETSAGLVKRASSSMKSLSRSLNPQDDLAISDSAKSRVMYLLFFVIFLDFSGNCMMAPVTPFLFNKAPDATQDQLDGGMAVYAKDAESIGVAVAMSLSTLSTMGGTAFASIFGLSLMKTFGKKGTLLCFTFGGCLTGIAAGFSVYSDWTMYGFFVTRLLSGFCAGSMPVVVGFISALYTDPAEMGAMMAKVGMPVGAALAVGPMFGTVLVGDYDRLYLPLFVAAGFQLLAGCLILRFVSEPEQQVSKKTGDQVAQDKPDYQKWVAIFWIAIFLDLAAGPTTVLRYIQVVVFFRWDTVKTQFPLIITLFSVCSLLAPPLFVRIHSRLGIAWTASTCQMMAGILCAILSVFDNVAPFLVVFYASTMLSMVGGTGRMQGISMMVPPSKRQMYVGMQSALTTLSMGLGPIMLAPVIDAEDWGPYPEDCSEEGTACAKGNDGGLKEGSFFFINAAVIIFSGILYGVLSKKLPPPRPRQVAATALTEDEEFGKKYYDDTGSTKWMSLPQRFEMIAELFRKAKQEGEDVSRVLQTICSNEWGDFQDDKDCLDRIRRLGRKGFEHNLSMFKTACWEQRHGESGFKEEIESNRPYIMDMIGTWTEDEKSDVGAWIVDYMRYAGYGMHKMHPNVYKACIMAAFPVILEDGWMNPSMQQTPIDGEVWRHFMIDLNRHYSNMLQMDDRHEQRQAMVGSYFRNLKLPFM